MTSLETDHAPFRTTDRLEMLEILVETVDQLTPVSIDDVMSPLGATATSVG